MNFKVAKRVILASASPRRKKLLNMIGIPFTVVPSNVSEELELEGGDFAAYARSLASRKAEAVASIHPNDIVIGADTIVVHEGKLYPKPKSKEQAKQFLNELSGKTHLVITGVAMYINDGIGVFSVETSVTFRELDAVLIDAYVDSGEPMDKAGAYGIQSAGALLVDKIDGDYYNVVGLPISKLTEHLRRYAFIALKDGDPFIDY
ncbi:Maf family protein [Sporosarcina limicola]|uniref:dTTP/UTP pyrophosphatase n=1 Tax=Sporosarcina limicola TaxID=34101 RepID=A0A927MK17_9BACL|nr:Maf family protein [Sporosarcina limicola]MBE1554572.1 septum formation protein [Sporosarcina limicola]